MVRELGLSKPTVISTLKSLEEKGGIYIINRVYKNNNEKTIDIVKTVYPDKFTTID